MHLLQFKHFLVCAIWFFSTCGLAHSSQEDDLQRARMLNQEANKLYQAGQYVEAIPKAKKVLKMYKRALGLLEESMGPDSPYMLTVLENLAICYRSMGKENQAQKVKERARIIRSKM
jgi:tetratricopeptide (TPR) repeat protein